MSECPIAQNGMERDSPFRKWQRPDLPSRCTYQDAKSVAESPHRHVQL